VADPILIVGSPSEWARDLISSLTTLSSDRMYVNDVAAALATAAQCQPRLVVLCRTPVESLGESGAHLRAAFPDSRIVILDDTIA
jgi:hypothetical protein